MIRLLTVILTLLVSLASSPVRAQQPAVDVALVLLADGSGSIDPEEFQLQRAGYADAIASPDVLSAIASNAHGRIAVAFVDWGGPQSQDVVLDWTIIDGEASAKAFGDKLRAAPKKTTGYNSISNAIGVAMQLLARAPQAERQVIDVSGDGPNIGGRAIHEARDEAVAKGIIINALAIRAEGSTTAWSSRRVPLEDYYRDNVIGGPGAFVEIARDRAGLKEAVRRKLIQEIAFLPAPAPHAASERPHSAL
ncbi:hypothetical protein GCM10007276_12890 [Agaricicola taiwanensis]|uniref:VWFA domain-containing protein n=1 Tax=Agaricicola taiwanensis TaxID=591372 RepID=A0A8J2VLN0_9RHOB|nr:DUF1194 domain-containing protein [Agaricicola taiwanensis]GGE36861.1 hypothetical protein GCM10007276_12890 [Agaricicola taiwanensis]